MKKRRVIFLIVFVILMVPLALGVKFLLEYFALIPYKYYKAEDFNIETIHSSVDFNDNGVDDYTDILLGARKDAENKPRYDGEYFIGGYPPDDMGVCTDLVWRAFKNAGYSLKDMVDEDIENNKELYPLTDEKPDPNIDFRRVQDLKIYFSRVATSLTLDIYDIKEWQPGDIVIFGSYHIGIISDKRFKNGIPYLLHNGGQYNREDNGLISFSYDISGHYRFDASKIVSLIHFN
ncbi:MAG: DUF1287 domain-containing protein [Oscillospiraceae bacterium]|nr:DUF1287 domain-containing protein [Oscillospiraceae bacterium]